MQFSVHKPALPLTRFVKSYWYLQAGGMDNRHRTVPEGHVTVMFHFGDTPHQPGRGKQPPSFIAPISRRPDELGIYGHINMAAIVFHPHGTGPFLPFPISEAGHCLIDSADAGCRWITELHSRMAEIPDPRRRTALINETLTALLSARDIPRNLTRVEATMAAIEKGVNEAGQLASLACLGQRQFARIFREATGISAKSLARIVRFQRSLYLMQIAPGASLTSIAHECGYTDQSHFIKEFSGFAGSSPGAYRNIWEPYSDYFS